MQVKEPSSQRQTFAAEAPVTFSLVYGTMSGNSVPLWIAKEQGFFRKYGLDPQLIFLIASRAAQAMPESSRRGLGIKTAGSTRTESQGRPA